ncbi:tumor necrosis factor receptor superfamily member 4-like isoform X2 [Stegostoma tigrinum]|uniref:tumor necrosis factor receptor superfamily member 4-like isoform X2 n=1 Tax=Stegostoma tigrinum TaxID=3053191 RepID=UPI00286FB75C|nr:tumor necrosis factor receptor superfamily member 4-like isoform X2 [Stegostoma tigrinum]
MELLAALVLLCASAARSGAVPRGCPAEFVNVNEGVWKSPCCSKCPPGTYMKEDCTDTSDSICVPCENGSYTMDWNNMYFCFGCTKCSDEGVRYKRSCTKTLDAQCECIEGYRCADENCRICVWKAPKSNACSPGTFSDTGTEPCRQWTNCTALGYLEVMPASLTRDAKCATGTVAGTVSQRAWETMIAIKKRKISPDQVEGGTIIVSVIIILLLCLLLGMQIALWKKNTKKRSKLLPATKIHSWYQNVQTEDTWSAHLPEQECGELSHQERKKVDQIYVSLNSVC